jgi:protein-tyrosine phosphatase
MKVLFVCLGNICRSPAAEGIFQKMLRDAKLDHKVSVDSAGTGGWHEGEPPDARMMDHARKRGYDLSQLEARQFSGENDFVNSDFIVTMDDSNYSNILALDPSKVFHARVHKLVKFCRIHNVKEVPDPYHKGPDGFEHVLDILEDACEQLLLKIKDTIK